MSLEVVLGPMFAGKSSYILTIVKRNASIGVPVLVVKPALDTRYSERSEVVTHDRARTDCIVVTSLEECTPHLDSHEVIIVEEAQFFSGLVSFVTHAVDTLQKRVILVGLDGDSQRRPFGELVHCIPLADELVKLKAMCATCRDGTPALFTHRRVADASQIHVGGADEYTPLCRRCYINAEATR
jgi:thymidine kinase